MKRKARKKAAKPRKIDLEEGYTVAPPFVQIAATRACVYGLDRNGRVWILADETFGWEPISSRCS